MSDAHVHNKIYNKTLTKECMRLKTTAKLEHNKKYRQIVGENKAI